MIPSVVIHGHFYQPPREDPFTGIIHPSQKSLNDIDWNQVIHEECYKPNAEMGNFQIMTFDLYRSLAEWMEKYDPATLRKIIESDNIAYKNDGFGTSFCGSWDHAILPLLRQEDIEIEVYWGIADYVKRYNHAPVGFWLAETAVSNDVLDILAKSGIRLIILAPWQSHNEIDTNKIYWVELKEGRRISVAFYNREVSSALSFDNAAMVDADTFANQYLANMPKNENTIIIGATDGERYGHHLKYGEKFLSQLMHNSINNIGFVGQSLTKAYAQSQPRDQAYINDNTSWSCLCGGLKRWKQDCDCCIDYNNYNKRVSGEWKKQLFEAINSLSDELSHITNVIFSELLHDGFAAKKEFIHVMLNQMTESEFINKYAFKQLNTDEIRIVLKLCEMQIYRLASYTSCGWFFSDIDRPEPRIVIANAKKALSILGDIGKVSEMLQLENVFVSALATIHSTTTEATGKDLYLEFRRLL